MDDNRFASVGAIVLWEDKVLLVRHTYGGAKGKLLNPSGFIKYGEMPYDALKREVLEETGVYINPIGILAVRCSVKDWWLIFLADYLSGVPRPDGIENSEALFMPCEEAVNHPDITDATKTLILLAKKGNILTFNADYANIPSSDGRMMFA